MSSDQTSKGRTGRPWRRLRARVRRTENTCHICGQPIDKTLPSTHPQSFTVDHVEPLALNPHLARERTNLRAAHRNCNSSKGTGKTPEMQRSSRDW